MLLVHALTPDLGRRERLGAASVLYIWFVGNYLYLNRSRSRHHLHNVCIKPKLTSMARNTQRHMVIVQEALFHSFQ